MGIVLVVVVTGGKTKSTPCPKTEVWTLDLGLELDNILKVKIKLNIRVAMTHKICPESPLTPFIIVLTNQSSLSFLLLIF